LPSEGNLTSSGVAMPPGPSSPSGSCSGLVKIYWSATGEVHALKGIDASFPSGAITAVVGPSGSGKSSLLRILACIDRPTAGQVRVGETEVSGLNARRRRAIRRRLVSYMFQRPSDNLVPYLSSIEQLQTTARLRGTSGRRQGHELLETLGLGGKEGHYPHQLSGGEQQRVALASAVMGDPALILADEPTAELDSAAGETLMEMVKALAEDGASFVVATHDPVVMRAADRIYSLRHGALEAETRADRALSVIDAFGRIQLPPDALKLFPDHRAVISIDDGQVRIRPP
jgi:putative ABC transport system ATP-binding protein